ncbi:MAG: hypothetical protein WAN93_07510 [Solirubrobacteraceae bacterium]
MEQLPYIDEHSIVVAASREQVWGALGRTLRKDLSRTAPAPLTGLLRLVPAVSHGDWLGTPSSGDTLPGFVVAEVHAPERLALRGRHRFSRYALLFELEATSAASCTLRARTWAEFPGLTGSAYRALVIGTRGHRLVVRRLLRNVSRRV